MPEPCCGLYHYLIVLSLSVVTLLLSCWRLVFSANNIRFWSCVWIVTAGSLLENAETSAKTSAAANTMRYWSLNLKRDQWAAGISITLSLAFKLTVSLATLHGLQVKRLSLPCTPIIAAGCIIGGEAGYRGDHFLFLTAEMVLFFAAHSSNIVTVHFTNVSCKWCFVLSGGRLVMELPAPRWSILNASASSYAYSCQPHTCRCQTYPRCVMILYGLTSTPSAAPVFYLSLNAAELVKIERI